MTLMPDPTTASSIRSSPETTLIHVCDVLEPTHRRALQPRPARHRQEGRGLSEVDRHRRHDLSSAPKPSSSCSTTSASTMIPTTPASKLDSSELPYNTGTEYEAAISATARAPRAATSRCRRSTRPGHALRDAVVMAEMGVTVEKHHHEVAPQPARARHEVRPAGRRWPTRCRSTSTASTRSRRPTARRRPSCRSRSIGDNGSGMHVPPVDLEGRQAAVRRQRLCRPVGDLPVLHRRHHQARQGDQRLHQPVDQLLQAPGAGLRGAGAARLFGAQPLGLLPHSARRPRRRPSASRSASPIRPPTPISASPRC
jgi:hypothetical protein